MVLSVRDEILPKPNSTPVEYSVLRRGSYQPVPTGYMSVNQAGVSQPINTQPGYCGNFELTYSARDPYWRLYQKNTRDMRAKGSMAAPLTHGHPYYHERTSLTAPTFKIDGVLVPLSYGAYHKGIGFLYPSTSCLAYARTLPTTAPDYGANMGVSFADAWQLGGTGIARTLPNVPPVSLFQVLGELREGMGRIPGSALKRLWDDPNRANVKHLKGGAKAYADEYLNIAFGLSPSIRTVTDLINLHANFDAALAKVLSPLTGTTRRSRNVRDDKSVTTSEISAWPPYTGMGATIGKLTTTDVKTQHVWVEATYDYRPAIAGAKTVLQDLLTYVNALGLTPNLDAMWELTPYSWLADYFLNAGSFTKNLSYLGRNGVGLHHAYLMAKTIVDTKWVWRGIIAGQRVETSVTRRVEISQRFRAHPLGFGFKTSITPGQWAILAALGVSRGKF